MEQIRTLLSLIKVLVLTSSLRVSKTTKWSRYIPNLLSPSEAQLGADLAVSLHRAHICQEVDPYSEVSSSQRERCAQTWLFPNSCLTAIPQRHLWWSWRPEFLTEGTPGHSSRYLGRSRLGVLETSHLAKWPTKLMLHEQCDIAWKLKFH